MNDEITARALHGIGGKNSWKDGSYTLPKNSQWRRRDVLRQSVPQPEKLDRRRTWSVPVANSRASVKCKCNRCCGLLLAILDCCPCNLRGSQRKSRHQSCTLITRRASSRRRRSSLRSSTSTRSTRGSWCFGSKTDTDLSLPMTSLISHDIPYNSAVARICRTRRQWKTFSLLFFLPLFLPFFQSLSPIIPPLYFMVVFFYFSFSFPLPHAKEYCNGTILVSRKLSTAWTSCWTVSYSEQILTSPPLHLVTPLLKWH